MLRMNCAQGINISRAIVSINDDLDITKNEQI